MTREQAINYLISSGFSEEQVSEVVRALTYDPTTKNNLGVDCISRADAIRVASGYCHPSNVAKELAKLPSVTLQEPRWIPVSERLPEEHICDDGYHEPSKSVLVQMKSGAMHTAQYWSRYDERWLGLNYPTTDEVEAWMPLPKPYELQESEDT